MQSACACSICGGRDGHSAAYCPTLLEPLRREGFFQPPGGRPSGGDDDERAVTTAKKLNGSRPRPIRIGRHLIATTATGWQPATVTAASALRR